MTGDHRATLWALAWLTATACASSEPETPLRIDGMSPEAGSARGGTTVEIRGAGLPAQASVLFGQVAAETTTTSGDTLTVRTPPGIAGEVVVTVVVGDGSHPVPGAFTYEKLTLALFDLAPERLAPRALWGGGAAAADVDGDGDLDVLQAGGLEGLLLHWGNGGLRQFRASQRNV